MIIKYSSRNKYIATVFLLSADKFLWKRAQRALTGYSVNFSSLTVTGNLIQSVGNVLVNGGELNVRENYRVQALNEDNYTTSPGTLTITDDSDTVMESARVITDKQYF